MFKVFKEIKKIEELSEQLEKIKNTLIVMDDLLKIRNARLDILEVENRELKEKIEQLLAAKTVEDERQESVLRDIQAIQNFSLDNVMSEIMKG